MAPARPAAWRARPPWRGPRARALYTQAAVVLIAAAAVALLVQQTATNLRQRGIASGFDYLSRAAGFELAPGLLPYSSHDSYARALTAGVVNTLRVSVTGIAIATLLGTAIGLARLSGVRIVAAMAGSAVETIRNTPLLLQLFLWYALWQALPGPRAALTPFAGVFVCSRGVFLPLPAWRDGALALDPPVLAAFNFRGGLSISPEFAALVTGLSVYTAAFIAEIVRGGVRAIEAGQSEAAAALGMTRGQALRLVLLPQALRAMAPPVTSQYLNLTKNSSLAVAIGFPDLVSITNSTLNQTGQAVEAIAIAAALYLGIGLVIALAMERLAARVDRVRGARR